MDRPMNDRITYDYRYMANSRNIHYDLYQKEVDKELVYAIVILSVFSLLDSALFAMGWYAVYGLAVLIMNIMD